MEQQFTPRPNMSQFEASTGNFVDSSCKPPEDDGKKKKKKRYRKKKKENKEDKEEKEKD